MLEIVAGAHLDWAWIGFVGLWLLGPLVVIVAATVLLRYWRRYHHR